MRWVFFIFYIPESSLTRGVTVASERDGASEAGCHG